MEVEAKVNQYNLYRVKVSAFCVLRPQLKGLPSLLEILLLPVSMVTRLIKTKRAAEISGYSREWLKNARLGYINHKGDSVPPLFTEGHEWFHPFSGEGQSPRCVLYVEHLLISAIQNGPSSEEHQRNIEANLRSLSQPKRLGRPSKTPVNVG